MVNAGEIVVSMGLSLEQSRGRLSAFMANCQSTPSLEYDSSAAAVPLLYSAIQFLYSATGYDGEAAAFCRST